MVVGTGIYAEMGYRGDNLIYKAELRVGGCTGIELSKPPEYDAAGIRRCLFCSGVIGYSLKAQGDGWLCIESGETGVWNTRVSLLQHCRRSDKHLYASSRTNRMSEIKTSNSRSALLQRLKIFGGTPVKRIDIISLGSCLPRFETAVAEHFLLFHIFRGLKRD